MNERYVGLLVRGTIGEVSYAGSMLTTIFRMILVLAHAGYAAITAVERRCAILRGCLVKIWQHCCQYETENERENDVLRVTAKRVEKLPRHLCIVIGHGENVSFFDLARILGWCIAVGIPHVSFYDHDGFLKRNRNVFRTEVERTRPKIAGLIEWESHATSKKVTENGSNGFKPRTRVQMFSKVDGKREIVTLAQNLSRAVILGLLKTDEIDTELLNEKLRLEDTPDPDLVFVCGPALSTYGLLPWHTRTTEFFNLRSHRDASVNDFTSLLEKYGHCEQRYGK